MPTSDQGVNLYRYMFVPRTMIILFREDKILLLKGAEDKRLWSGLYNGLGGHIEQGEDVLSSAKRELFEEAGLIVNDLFLCGIVTVDTQTNPGVCIFIFKGYYSEGNLRTSREGTLEWINQNRINELPLVPDLPKLLPKIICQEHTSQPFIAHSLYDNEGKISINFV